MSLTIPLLLEGKNVLYCCIAAIPFSVLVYVVVYLLSRVSLRVDGGTFNNPLVLFCCVAGSLMAIWAVGFFVLFPGCFSTDSADVLKMIWGIPFESDWFRYDGLNNHHPAFYIFLNFIAVRIGEVLGFGQMGCVSVVAFMHAVTLACCCGFVACEANRLFEKKIVAVLCWVFFFFDPLLIWYSVTAWKDVIFSAAFVCFALLLAEVVLRPMDFSSKRWRVVLLILFAVGSSLLRSNGFLAVGASLLAVCIVTSGPIRRLAVVSTMLTVVVYLVVIGPVYRIAGVSSAHFSETVGVPLQQISRVVHDGGVLSEEEEQYLDAILPMEEWRDSYNPATPNSIKFSSNFSDEALEGDKLQFISRWLTIGLENPGIYFRAWIAQTRDYWSLESSTWYIADSGYDLGDGEKKNSHLGNLLTEEDLAAAFGSAKSALPFLYSIGFLAWSMLGGLLVAFLNGRCKSVIFFLPFVAIWATFLLAAPANDFRYMLSLHLAFPLFVLFAFWDFRENKEISPEKKQEELLVQC